MPRIVAAGDDFFPGTLHRREKNTPAATVAANRPAYLRAHFEVAGLHDVAVERDLDAVTADRPAVRLADLEVRDAAAVEPERLRFLVDDLAVLERPAGAERAARGRSRRAGVGGDRRGDRVGRREGA